MVRSDGVLVTNAHVIVNTRTNRPYDDLFLSLSSDGETTNQPARYHVTLLVINNDYDLALLRVDSDPAGKPLPKSFTFPAVELGDSKKIKLLDDLFIIGFPEKRRDQRHREPRRRRRKRHSGQLDKDRR
jgi:S1-C subfamily serine protease